MSSVTALAIVGGGEMGISRAVIAKALPSFDVACLVEPQWGVGRIAAKQVGCAHYRSYARAASKEHFDAVIVCTPPAGHAEVATQAIDDGKHVLVEKPLCTSAGDSLGLLRRAEQAGVVHQVGFDLRFSPTVVEARRILGSGCLGALTYVHARSHESRVLADADRQKRREVQQQGELLPRLGVHIVDLVLSLCGPISSIAAMGTERYGTGTEDFITAACRFENGAHGVLDFSWSIPGQDWGGRDLTLGGERGMLTVTEDELRIVMAEDTEEFAAGENVVPATELPTASGFQWTGKHLAGDLEAFAAAIGGQNAHRATFADGYLADLTIEQIYAAARSGRAVQICPEEAV